MTAAFDRVLANPGSMAAREALAAEWKRADDPRYPLIEKQLRDRALRAKGEVSRTLRDEIKALVAAKGSVWAGKIDGLVESYKFHRGLVAEVRVKGQDWPRIAKELVALAPIQHLELAAPLGDLDALFAVPELRQMVSLSAISLETSFGDAGAIALARSPLAANLRWIDLAGDAIGEAGVEALAASPYLDRARYISFLDNPCNPTPRAEIYDGVLQASRPPKAAELERTYGPRPWLAVPEEELPLDYDAFAITP